MVACFLCKSASNRKAKECSFFRIPKEKAGIYYDLANKSDIGTKTEFLRVSYLKYRICEKHFNPEDIQISNGKKSLKSTAIPRRLDVQVGSGGQTAAVLGSRLVHSQLVVQPPQTTGPTCSVSSAGSATVSMGGRSLLRPRPASTTTTATSMTDVTVVQPASAPILRTISPIASSSTSSCSVPDMAMDAGITSDGEMAEIAIPYPHNTHCIGCQTDWTLPPTITGKQATADGDHTYVRNWLTQHITSIQPLQDTVRTVAPTLPSSRRTPHRPSSHVRLKHSTSQVSPGTKKLAVVRSTRSKRLRSRLYKMSSTPVKRPAEDVTAGFHSFKSHQRRVASYISTTFDASILASDPAPSTSDLQPSTSDLQRSTSDLQPSTSDLQPSTSDLQPSTSDLQPSTSDLQPSTSTLLSSTSGLSSYVAAPHSSVTDQTTSRVKIEPRVQGHPKLSVELAHEAMEAEDHIGEGAILEQSGESTLQLEQDAEQETAATHAQETIDLAEDMAGAPEQTIDTTLHSEDEEEPGDLLMESSIYADEEDIDPESINYSANASAAIVSSEEDLSDDGGEAAQPNRKHIVYQSCLADLVGMIRCPCGNKFTNLCFNENKGTLLVINATCNRCRTPFKWRSQPSVARKARGNVELTAAIYLSGLTFTAINKWCQTADIHWLSMTTYYDYQHSHILPVVNRRYQQSLNEAAEAIIAKGDPVRLAADGRFDSPGYSARYCTYTVIDSDSGLVTDSLTKQTALSTSSVMTEKDCFIASLEKARETFSRINIKSITTDGNTQIRAYMKSVEGILHGLDVWHLNKNLAKNISKKSTKVAQKKLLKWLQHLTNHIWWAADQCKGDSDLLQEMVQSMRYHLVNQHQDFWGHTHFKQCAHGPIERTDDLDWLSPGDPAHTVLVNHLTSKQFLSQVGQVAHGTHTGCLEVLHSLFLAYAPKRIDFDPMSYEGRIKLAVLDHNENVGRPLKKDSDGRQIYSQVWSKAVKGWRLKKVYTAKTFRFRNSALSEILEHARSHTLNKAPGRDRGERISRGVEKPTIEEAQALHLQRL